jgi:uncharacterized secreted protein with C-terminal beta-propeller domain
MKDERRKGISVILLLVMLPTTVCGLLLLKDVEEHRGGAKIRRFASLEQLEQFLASHQGGAYWPYVLDGGNSFMGTAPLARESAVDAMVEPRYSATNVQVEGIDEADIVKTDGRFLYIVSERKIRLIAAYPPESMATLSEIDLEGRPAGIFISGDRLVTFEQTYPEWPVQYREGDVRLLMSFIGNVSVKVYDISDRGVPRLLQAYKVNGLYSDSRMLGHYVYLVVSEPAMICEEEVILPRIYDCEDMTEVTAEDISYYESSSESQHSFTTIFAIDVQDESAEPAHETFLTAASDAVFMSRDNIYIAQTVWEGVEGGIIEEVRPGMEMTIVHKIHVRGLGIEYVANGEVPGRVLNQFSMDEFDGFFRISTSASEELTVGSGRLSSVTNLYVLDSDMNVVGALEGLAPGERMYSARFMGDRCYIVTFKKVDPLFVVDLSRPADPRVLGKLKIPGYSQYLHPFGDGFLIGIGKETVEAEEGDFAWYQGIKISLFDVRDLDNPKEVSKLVIGSRGTDSPVLYDHKALMIDEERGLLVMPVLVAEIDPSKYPDGVPPNAYGEFTWQGAYVLHVSVDDGITLLGRITHLEGNEDLIKSGFYFGSRYSVQRALFVNDALYTLSDGRIKANDISTLGELNSLVLEPYG